MQIIITGCGFIGCELAKLLSKQYEIVIVSTNPKKFSNAISYDEFIKYDLSNVKAVVNLAGVNILSHYWTKSFKNKIIKSRVETTKLIVNKLKNSNIHLIQASAVGYYGNTTNPTTENAKNGKGFLAYVCKLWEEISNEYTNTAIIMTGFVLGDKTLPKILLPFKFKIGVSIGKNNYIPWIDIEDEIRAIEFLIENNLKGVYNLTAPNPIKAYEFYDTIKKLTNTKIMINIPSKVIKILLKDMSEIFIEGQNALPSNLLNNGFEFKYRYLKDSIRRFL